MDFYIYAPSFDPNSGGCIALHKLVHIINEETSHNAYIIPWRLEKINFNSIRGWLGTVKNYILLSKKRCFFKVNSSFNTPVANIVPKSKLTSAIVVYPEVTFGNPLQAKNIVRWFLHQPGHLTKEICYGPGELYYKFNQAIKDFELYNSYLSDVELKVIHYPLETYNLSGSDKSRKGTCHLVRKGKLKPKIHDSSSICIDGMSHEEIADVFKKCEYFISYDDYTAYSIFAILCGCKSIVVPGDGVSIDEWYPEVKDRYGISYGKSEEQMEWAESTKHKVPELINNEHLRSIQCVKDFITESQDYFDIN